MEFLEQVSLQNFSTLKVGGVARYFTVARNVNAIQQALVFAKENKVPWFILGGGSNVLFPDTGYPGLVVKIELKGIACTTSGNHCIIEVGAGEVWDEVVAYAVAQGWYGIENLSFIPGSVGAAPVQNIGAYGSEVASTIEWVDVWDSHREEMVRLPKEACNFSYRNSLFKTTIGKHLIITSVGFKLALSGSPNLSYRDVAEYFKHAGIPQLHEVRNAIGSIRSKKFPDLRTLGTAGSFFKNPMVTKEAAFELREKFPELPLFPLEGGTFKFPLAWVLDNVLHLKGVRHGLVGTFEAQPLVIVTYAGARARDVQDFAEHIKVLVREKIGIEIEEEVVMPKM